MQLDLVQLAMSLINHNNSETFKIEQVCKYVYIAKLIKSLTYT